MLQVFTSFAVVVYNLCILQTFYHLRPIKLFSQDITSIILFQLL